MGARAEAAERTRQRILGAARESFWAAEQYGDVTLEQIAKRAGVSLKTVLRRFASKDALLLASSEAEADERAVPPGDLEAIVRVLSTRYEASMDVMLRYITLEPRISGVAQLLRHARRGHWRWLEQAFAPFLPARGPLRRQRVAQLFVMTEIYSWHALRRRLGLGARLAEHALRESLGALVACWAAESAAKGEPHA